MKLEGFETFGENFEKYSNEKKNDIKKCIYLFLNIEYPKYLLEKDIKRTKQTTLNFFDSTKLITNIAIEDSFHTVLKNFASDKYDIKIYKPTLKHILNYYNTGNLYTFFDEKLKYIYSKIIPKKYKKDKNNKKDKNYEEPIDDALTLEKEGEKENNRKFDLLLNHGIIIIVLNAFVSDEKFITIRDNNGNEFRLYLINFKTYKDFFGHLSNIFFIRFKNYYIALLSKKIHSRERPKIKDLEEKEKDLEEEWKTIDLKEEEKIKDLEIEKKIKDLVEEEKLKDLEKEGKGKSFLGKKKFRK